MALTARVRKQEACPTQRTAGVDWCRLILDDPHAIKDARDFAQAIQRQDVREGGKIGRFHFEGYRGKHTDSIRWGEQGWELLIETSGEAAPAIARQLASFGGRCTRLDVQTTVHFSAPQPRYGMRCLRLRDLNQLQSLVSQRLLGLRLDTKGYWCGTVDSRTSESVWRCYDKGAERRSAPRYHTWRLENELKYRAADPHWKALCASPDATQWCSRHVVSSWRRDGYFWPLRDSDSGMPPVEIPRRPPASHLALSMWLRRTVQPVVKRLLMVYSPDELLDMLGLADVCRSSQSDDTPRPRRPAVPAERADMGCQLALPVADALGSVEPGVVG
jgi:hypothetical protein